MNKVGLLQDKLAAYQRIDFGKRKIAGNPKVRKKALIKKVSRKFNQSDTNPTSKIVNACKIKLITM